MPTTFKLKSEYGANIEAATELINAVKNYKDKRLSEEELETVKKVINNSIIGTSKLLHFINPSLYPIWDSRICKLLLNKSSYSVVSKTDNYVDYFECCNNLIANTEFDKLLNLINNALDKAGYKYKVSKIRALEMILFYNSQS